MGPDERYGAGGILRETDIAIVSSARDRTMDRAVALTELRPELDGDPVARRLFVARRAAAAALTHPAIARVFDVSVDDDGGDATGPLWYVGEALDGRTLEEAARPRGGGGGGLGGDGDDRGAGGVDGDPVHADSAEAPGECVTRLAIEAAEAMEYAHRAGFVHGDLRPGTVVLVPGDSGREHVKIVGFGPQLGDLDLLAADQTDLRAWRRHIESLGERAPELSASAAPTRAADVFGYAGVVRALAAATGASSAALDRIAERASAAQPGARPDFAAVLDDLRTPGVPVAPAVDVPLTLAFGRPEARAEEAVPTERIIRPTAKERQAALRARSALPASSAGAPARGAGRRRPGRRRLLSLPGGMFLLLMAAVVAAAAWGYTSDHDGADARTASVIVPNVAGQQPDAAAALLRKSGLAVAGQRTVPSDTVEAGRATGTDPAAGDRQSRGDDVTILIAAGATPASVPQVRGLTLTDAHGALERAGLAAGSIVNRDGTDAAGTVLDSSPGFGTGVPRGSTVALVVASGQQRVPNGLTGQAAQPVVDALTAAGFPVQVVTMELADAAPDTVVSVSPGEGSRQRLGTPITITVATAPARAVGSPGPVQPAPTPSGRGSTPAPTSSSASSSPPPKSDR